MGLGLACFFLDNSDIHVLFFVSTEYRGGSLLFASWRRESFRVVHLLVSPTMTDSRPISKWRYDAMRIPRAESVSLQTFPLKAISPLCFSRRVLLVVINKF